MLHHGSTVIVTAPTALPVTLAEAKAQCRVMHDEEDSLIEGLIEAATAHVELVTGRAIMPQTLERVLPAFCNEILLAKGPATEIIEVRYYDVAGDEQTLASAAYQFDAAGDPQRVLKAPGASWPATATRPDAVAVQYEAGFETVPPAIRQAILLLVGQWYEQREAASEKPSLAMANGIEALLANHRAFAF